MSQNLYYYFNVFVPGEKDKHSKYVYSRSLARIWHVAKQPGDSTVVCYIVYGTCTIGIRSAGRLHQPRIRGTL